VARLKIGKLPFLAPQKRKTSAGFDDLQRKIRTTRIAQRQISGAQCWIKQQDWIEECGRVDDQDRPGQCAQINLPRAMGESGVMQFRVSDLGPSATASVFLGPDAVRRIGLVVLETDHTMEGDFARLTRGSGVVVVANRVAYANNPTTPEALGALTRHLTEGAARLLPGLPLDVVHFGCTSASAVIGDSAVTRAIQAAKPGVQVTNPLVATSLALRAVGARRVSILTPYTPAISAPVAQRLSDAGFTMDGLTCWNLGDDREMARIRPEVIVREAIAATAAEADALFISCTAVPSAALVEEIEAALGRPVITSNQAGAWLALRLCGVETPVAGGGRLFTFSLPTDGARHSLGLA